MKLRLFIALALIPQILIVNYLKSNPSIVDDYFFGFIYNEVFKINSFIFSKTSIPVGELLYLIILISFIYLVFKLFSFKLKHFINLIAFISIVHFFFYSFWGLNYFRTPVSERLKINSDYEYIELDKTIEKIIIQIDKEISLINKENNISNVLELIDKTNSNIKKSILPDIFLYQRVSGHFIPFTSEGVFIDKIPLIDIPVVIFHEQAHQMGYADEGEASFIGFKKAIMHNDPYIRYSGYFNALMNLLNEVIKNHPEKLENYMGKLDKKVISDIGSVQNFWSKYSDNIFDKITNYIYDIYLKSNNQEAGIMTYNKVSIYIIDYYQSGELSKFID